MVTTLDRRGLTSEEAAARLARDGPNRLPASRRRSAARRLADQLVNFFALLLWVAAALALVAGLPQLTVAIAAVVVLNAAFAFAQEERATRAADRLRDLLPAVVAVRRDGRRAEIDAVEVVVGDVLLLSAGDRVPADGDVADAHGLRVDTSMLTGESEPSAVETGPVFAGTFVVEGDANVVIVATGARTRIAEIAQLLAETESPASPLVNELHHVVRTLAVIAVGVGALFLAIWLALGNALAEGLVFAIGVTVALVPEALLPTVTLSLAWGAEELAKRNVLVRQLDAVETLGSTTFVCTDKTGTLTVNRMTVVASWTPPWVTVDELLRAAVVCSGPVLRPVGGGRAGGDPMEIAIDDAARLRDIDTDALRASVEGAVRFPFDPRRRLMSVVLDREVVVKGAPDALLACASRGDGAAEELARLTAKGLRVIGVARRMVTSVPVDRADVERDLELLGLLALEDPPRLDARDAIARCRRAGIRVAMITGDHPATAAAIAAEVGLLGTPERVIVGDDLPDDDAALGELVDLDGVVVARVSPEQKVRIARALRARGHVVAMTGDGVNDGPALNEADIGIAMGRSGTDVAREAADLVLLDDSFASIVDGIEQGRATFVNVRRFLTYHLADNVAELMPFLVWGLSGGSLPLALGVMQILALDIGTDTLSATALGAEPPARHLLDGPPVAGRLLNRTVLRRAFGLIGPVEAALSLGAFAAVDLSGGSHAEASGAAFLTVVLGQAANAFACRSSTRWPGSLGWLTNRLLPPAVAAGIGFSLAVLLVPAAADALDQSVPPPIGWAVAVASPAVVLAVDAADKRRRAAAAARRPTSTAPPTEGPSCPPPCA